MPVYLAEVYLAAAEPAAREATIARARKAARRLARAGTPVRYLHSTYLPADEICFLFFEADADETLARLGAEASIAFDRISPTEIEP